MSEGTRRETITIRVPNTEGYRQYGNVRAFPRTMPMDRLISAGLKWVLEDVTKVLGEAGIPVELALPTLETYYTPAVRKGGSGHDDPLMQRPYPKAPVVHAEHLVAWKCGVWHEDEAATGIELVEGEPPEVQR